MTVTVEGVGQKVAGEQRQRLEMLMVSVLFLCISLYVSSCAECSQRGQGVQCVEGARVHRGDLVVVE